MDVPTVVVELGIERTKVGMAGSATPIVLPSLVPTMADGKREFSALEDCAAACEYVQALDPLSGLVRDWDAAEALLLEACRRSSGSATSIADHAVMLVEPLLVGRAERERWCQLLFERHKVSAVFFGKAGVMSLYANARVTGVSIDLGAGGVTVTAVQSGFPLKGSSIRLPLGGQALDNLVASECAKAGHTLRQPPASSAGAASSSAGVHSSVESYHALRIARQLREAMCMVQDPEAEDSEMEAAPAARAYTLPDGTVFHVPVEIQLIPNVLFDVGPVAGKVAGAKDLAAAVVQAVMASDPEIRGDLMSNVVVCGGLSATPGLLQRLARELDELAPVGTHSHVVAAEADERAVAAWLGGSILSSLGTFPDLWVTAAEYKAQGPAVVHAKCP